MRTNFGPEISPGFKTNIIVQRTFEEILPKPYSECDAINPDDPSYADVYARILALNYDYTQQLCYTDCFHKSLIDTCGCVKPNELTFFPKIKPCELTNKCLNNFTKITFDYGNCNCPLQCNRTQYLFSLSMLPLNYNYTEYINKNFALDFLPGTKVDAQIAKESVARIYIFYDSLSYIKSIETITSGSVLELISNIGGILGLFLGVSLLSLFEVVDVLIQIGFIWHGQRVKTSVQTTGVFERVLGNVFLEAKSGLKPQEIQPSKPVVQYNNK